MVRRIGGALASIAFFFSVSAIGEEAAETPILKAVPVSELTAKAPQPSWDTGLLLAACGVGNSAVWQKTKFCLGGMSDVLWGRDEESEAAFGAYAQVGTAGFRDLRISVGGAYLLPLGQWLVGELRVGPLLRISSHPAYGAQGTLELGQRSFSYQSRYSLSHALLVGMDFTAENSQLPANTAIWLGIRVDAYWLTAPAMLLQL